MVEPVRHLPWATCEACRPRGGLPTRLPGRSKPPESGVGNPPARLATPPRTGGHVRCADGGVANRLVVVVEVELVRVRAQPQRIDLVLHLVVDPPLDHVLREDAALEQELVVLLQGLERLDE